MDTKSCTRTHDKSGRVVRPKTTKVGSHDFGYQLAMTQSDVSAFSNVPSERAAPEAVAVRAGGVAPTIEQFIFGAAILGLAWVPFWLGSNREIAWLINAGYFGTLVVLLEAVLLVGRRAHPVAIKRVAYPAVIFALTCVWIIIQASTWIPAWLENSIYQYGRETLGIDLPGSITINRALTYMALLRLLTEGAVFWLFLQLCRSPQRAHWTIQAVAIIGMAYAIYGIVAFFVFPEQFCGLPNLPTSIRSRRPLSIAIPMRPMSASVWCVRSLAHSVPMFAAQILSDDRRCAGL